GGLPDSINMAALADPQATTVVYMGRRTFTDLAAKLIAHGLSPETPALLAEAVSTPEQKISRHTIASLAVVLKDAVSPNPALIFYGPLAEFPA
ncbi:MAG: Uroporphyrin-III C-methyltransferase, partial [uncultured bacterium]